MRGAQINFRDLTPYLTYKSHGGEGCPKEDDRKRFILSSTLDAISSLLGQVRVHGYLARLLWRTAPTPPSRGKV